MVSERLGGPANPICHTAITTSPSSPRSTRTARLGTFVAYGLPPAPKAVHHLQAEPVLKQVEPRLAERLHRRPELAGRLPDELADEPRVGPHAADHRGDVPGVQLEDDHGVGGQGWLAGPGPQEGQAGGVVTVGAPSLRPTGPVGMARSPPTPSRCRGGGSRRRTAPSVPGSPGTPGRGGGRGRHRRVGGSASPDTARGARRGRLHRDRSQLM